MLNFFDHLARAFIILSVFCFPTLSMGQTEEPPRVREPSETAVEPLGGPTTPQEEPLEDPTTSQKEIMVAPRPNRFSVGYGLSVLSFPFPLRRGPYVAVNINPHWQVGGQYTADSLNLRLGGIRFGGAKEKSWLVQGRWFPQSRFHVALGLGQREFRLNLASSELTSLVNASQADDMIVLRHLIADVSLAHRWVFKRGVTLQADWLSLTIPISRSEVEGTVIDSIADPRIRSGTKKAIGILGRAPGGALLGVSVGYTY